MSIRGLWESQMEAIIDVRFEDSDAATWKTEKTDKFVTWWEKIEG